MIISWCRWLRSALALALLGVPISIFAGGSGLNVMVVVNQNSSNSVALGNYYMQKREVPPQNLLRIYWSGANTQWAQAEFQSALNQPLADAIAGRELTNQIDFVVLSMDIPYRVTATNGANSTTSALLYGFKPDRKGDSCSMPTNTLSPYAGTEAAFRSSVPFVSGSNSFMAMMVTSSNLAQAKRVIDQGVAGDFTFPQQPIYLAKSTDRLRNVRHLEFDSAVFNARLLGQPLLVRTNADGPADLGYMAGYQNGVGLYNIGQAAFAPGSMADHLTSFAGMLFEPNDQTTLLDLLQAGAAGSYGTVIEPCSYLEKFPSSQNYFYQGRGFALAECYYQSLYSPYQGLLVGEPLSAPFASRASGSWRELAAAATLIGTTNLHLTAGSLSGKPLQQVDLFVDGTFFATLTNIAPAAGNTLRVTLNGTDISQNVPTGASIQSLAALFTAAINKKKSVTSVEAITHGDRIELQSTDLTRPASEVTLSASSATGSAAGLTTFLTATSPNFMEGFASGLRSVSITNVAQPGDYLQLVVVKTNSETVALSVTNTAPGTNLDGMVKSLIQLGKNEAALQGPAGVLFEDLDMHEEYPYNPYAYGTNDHSGTFNVRASSTGWQAAQVKFCLRGSATFKIDAAGTNRLDENLEDLRPRAHLYIGAGVTNLDLNFSLDTTALPDGWHELTAVAYEGSSVRTQTRFSQIVQVQNTSLSGALALPANGTNIFLGSPLKVQVTGNAGNATIQGLQLFSTGGQIGAATAQPSATFTIDTGLLGPGEHPLYALITQSGGKQYRTPTQWVRIIDPATPDEPFAISWQTAPAGLSWPATIGRRYEVLSATALDQPFTVAATLTAANSPTLWLKPGAESASGFYRVRTAN